MRINPISNTTFNGILRVKVYDDNPIDNTYRYRSIDTDDIVDINENKIITSNGDVYISSKPNHYLMTAYDIARKKESETEHCRNGIFEKVYKPEMSRTLAMLNYLLEHNIATEDVLLRKFGKIAVEHLKVPMFTKTTYIGEEGKKGYKVAGDGIKEYLSDLFGEDK